MQYIDSINLLEILIVALKLDVSLQSIYREKAQSEENDIYVNPPPF